MGHGQGLGDRAGAARVRCGGSGGGCARGAGLEHGRAPSEGRCGGRRDARGRARRALPGGITGREAATTEGRAADAWPAPPGPMATGLRVPLLPHAEREQWETRLLQTAAGFVDAPRTAVEEADRELEEIATRFTEAVTRRRRTLRMSWQEGVESDTEQLRLALRDYEELAGRLLHF
ncbi:hypothetical protein O1M54_34370 [Streptomyces diastatochromogenes]|nr:hypothetical protein [Streptomyces diastatochromogenes]